jgi:hypothetical protein
VSPRPSVQLPFPGAQRLSKVWTFVVEKAVFKMEGDTIGPFSKVKIVACKGTPAEVKESTSKKES